MEKPKSKNESGNYDKLLFSLLKSLVGKRCRIVLKDGSQPEGNLNHVGFNAKGDPWIIVDMGDTKISAQYNLSFDNILHVMEIK